MKEFIETIFNGWPILGDNNMVNFDPLETQSISRKYGIRQIVNVYVTTNPLDPTLSVLRVIILGFIK